jgi:hypothetical protein
VPGDDVSSAAPNDRTRDQENGEARLTESGESGGRLIAQVKVFYPVYNIFPTLLTAYPLAEAPAPLQRHLKLRPSAHLKVC